MGQGRADLNALQAGGTALLVAGYAFSCQGKRLRGTAVQAFPAAYTAVGNGDDLQAMADAFGVVTPEAVERTPLEEDGGPDIGTVMEGIPFDGEKQGVSHSFNQEKSSSVVPGDVRQRGCHSGSGHSYNTISFTGEGDCIQLVHFDNESHCNLDISTHIPNFPGIQ